MKRLFPLVIIASAIGGLFLAGFSRNPIAFLLILPGLLILIAVAFVWLTADLLWIFLPRPIRETHRNRPWRYRVFISICYIVSLCGILLIEEYFPLYKLPFRVAAFTGLGGLVFFLGWTLICLNAAGKLWRGFIVFLLFFSVLTAWASLTASEETTQSSEEELKALPYATWVSPRTGLQQSGVTHHEKNRAYPGLNLFDSANLSKAFLMDMEGRIHHKWTTNIHKNVPWQNIELKGNGDLLAILKDQMLIQLSFDSRVQWIRPLRIHHDVALGANGDIYAIVRKDEIVFLSGFPIPILNDYILRLSPDGHVKEEHSIYPFVQEQIPEGTAWRIYRWLFLPENLIGLAKRAWKSIHSSGYLFEEDTPLDILHTNAVEWMEKDIPGFSGQGNMLISVRQLNLIAVIDLSETKLIWSWGSNDLIWQHHPSLLPNGNILIFDNGYGREYSRVVELDPRSKTIVWKFTANPPKEFYSRRRGSCQRLPNGNTLITESNSGRVFEITKNGEIVWEFHNPEMNRTEGKRAAIYRMIRLTDVEQYPFLKGLLSQKPFE